MKKEVCQNSEQNTTADSATVCKKVYLSSLERAYKVVAFQEIAKADGMKSARDIAKILDTPNSSMQTWLKQGSLKDKFEDEISAFLSTVAGQIHLGRVVNASMYNNKVGSSGILGVQQFLRHAQLDKWVASSAGTLQAFWERMQGSIIDFGEEQEKAGAEKMKKRKICATLDEMFRHSFPCLVAIETVSNFILFSKFTENRQAETWKKELKENITEKFPVTIGQIQSDLCGTIGSVTKSVGAIHSPDLFHGMQEFSKATSAAMASQERAAEKALRDAEADHKKLKEKPLRIDMEEKKKQKEQQGAAKKKCEVIKVVYKERKERREKTQKARKELGQIYHPVNLATGEMQSATIVKKKIEEQIDAIKANAEDAGLAGSSLERIEKGRRAFHLMEEYLRKFFIFFYCTHKKCTLNP